MSATRKMTVRFATYAVTAGMTLIAVSANSDSAAQQAGDGGVVGITISRQVPYRSAVRLGYPAPPRIVRTSPEAEVLAAVRGGIGGAIVAQPITDLEAANISANSSLNGSANPALGSIQTLQPTTFGGARAGGTSGSFGGSIGAAGMAAGRSVGAATAGLGQTIQRAVGATGF